MSELTRGGAGLARITDSTSLRHMRHWLLHHFFNYLVWLLLIILIRHLICYFYALTDSSGLDTFHLIAVFEHFPFVFG